MRSNLAVGTENIKSVVVGAQWCAVWFDICSSIRHILLSIIDSFFVPWCYFFPSFFNGSVTTPMLGGLLPSWRSYHEEKFKGRIWLSITECSRLLCMGSMVKAQKLGGVRYTNQNSDGHDIICLTFQVPLCFVVGDAERHEVLCGSYQSHHTKYLSQDCDCPMDEAFNPK
jgi:hypothetical protein